MDILSVDANKKDLVSEIRLLMCSFVEMLSVDANRAVLLRCVCLCVWFQKTVSCLWAC